MKLEKEATGKEFRNPGEENTIFSFCFVFNSQKQFLSKVTVKGKDY